MNEWNPVIAWLAPLLLSVFMAVQGTVQRRKEKRIEEERIKWNSLHKLVETTSLTIDTVQRQVHKLENEVNSSYLPRREFTEFINSLDVKFNQLELVLSEQEEKHNEELLTLVQETIRSNILELKVELLKSRIPV